MRTHTRAHTQHGLDADRGGHWTALAECRHDPDAFFAPAQGFHWRPVAQLHTCRVHCPVRVECAQYAAAQPSSDRAGMVLGGVAYNSRGEPARWSDEAARTCPRCRDFTPLLAAEPRKHGTVAAIRWHRDNRQALCPECRRCDARRDATNARARAYRAARISTAPPTRGDNAGSEIA